MKTSTFDTTILPEAARFAAWADPIEHFRCAPLSSEPFVSQVRFWTVSRLIVTEQRLSPVSFIRDAQMLLLDQVDHVSLIVLLEGECRYAADGTADLCEPGDVILCDWLRPSEAHCTAQYSFAILVPRAFLHEAIEVPRGGRLPRSSATRLLVEQAVALVRHLPDLPDASAVLMARVLRDLLATALMDMAPAAQPIGSTAQRERAKTHIASLTEGSLDVTAMSRALGLSRSALYRLFRREGGVLAYDRRRRLVVLHGCLADPVETRGIAELGHAHGFHDAAQLSQLFRRTFGYSASELRNNAAALGDGGPLHDTTEHYRNAVRTL